MPIDHSRLMDVVKESEDTHAALVAFREGGLDLLRADATPQDVLTALYNMLNDLRIPPVYATKIERYHYEKFHRLNEKQKHRMAGKRILAATPRANAKLTQEQQDELTIAELTRMRAEPETKPAPKAHLSFDNAPPEDLAEVSRRLLEEDSKEDGL